MTYIQRSMRFFFHLLYHPLAYAYDLIAAAVSFGKWNDWVLGVTPFISGTRILELGHGPGHLQRFLLDRGMFPVAIDESPQIGRLAKRRSGTSHKLSRALAQQLPFAEKSFDTIVATFPTDYIFNAQTLSEAKRCLSDRGRLIVLPVAFPKNSLLKWLYKVTGESPSSLTESIRSEIKRPFIDAEFITAIETVEVKSSTLLIVIATSSPKGKDE